MAGGATTDTGTYNPLTAYEPARQAADKQGQLVTNVITAYQATHPDVKFTQEDRANIATGVQTAERLTHLSLTDNSGDANRRLNQYIENYVESTRQNAKIAKDVADGTVGAVVPTIYGLGGLADVNAGKNYALRTGAGSLTTSSTQTTANVAGGAVKTALGSVTAGSEITVTGAGAASLLRSPLLGPAIGAGTTLVMAGWSAGHGDYRGAAIETVTGVTTVATTVGFGMLAGRGALAGMVGCGGPETPLGWGCATVGFLAGALTYYLTNKGMEAALPKQEEKPAQVATANPVPVHPVRINKEMRVR